MKSVYLSLLIIFSVVLVSNASYAASVDLSTILTGELYDTVSFGTYITNRNILTAYEGGAHSPDIDGYGLMKFDLSILPDNILITNAFLTTYHYYNPPPANVHSPHNDPTVYVRYFADDHWHRGGTTAPSFIGAVMGTGTGFPSQDKASFMWNLDVSTQSWVDDLSDDFLSLALDIAQTDYRFVYFYGSGESDPANHAYDPTGLYAPMLHVEYELMQPTTVPEPGTMLLFCTGMAGLALTRIIRKKK